MNELEALKTRVDELEKRLEEVESKERIVFVRGAGLGSQINAGFESHFVSGMDLLGIKRILFDTVAVVGTVSNALEDVDPDHSKELEQIAQRLFEIGHDI